MSVLNISNIVGGRNIASQLVTSGESVANPISTSDRFMEKGDYIKVHNATLKYSFGDIGKSLKNVAGTKSQCYGTLQPTTCLL